MNVREQHGLLIASKGRVKKSGKGWIVPSQSYTSKKYTVTVESEKYVCGCVDYQTAGEKCKHIFAVEFTIDREYSEDGNISNMDILKISESRRTYRQNWPVYNRVQTVEKSRFQKLLYELCGGLQRENSMIGRPRLPIDDGIFSAVFKVYTMFSGRRFIDDLCNACEHGFIRRVPHYNTILNVLDSKETNLILKDLIVQTSLPFTAIESVFAVDSTGFSGSVHDKWFDERYGEKKSERAWVKAHIMIGTKTHVVTVADVLKKFSADSIQLKPLLDKTRESFTVKDVCGDMAYSSKENLAVINEIGATPLIPFKRNSVPSLPGIWNDMYHYFHLKRDEFLKRYHLRSNVESTFSMIKRKFGSNVRAKTEEAMRNEVLAKILCHNICCLIQSIEEFGIDPDFRRLRII